MPSHNFLASWLNDLAIVLRQRQGNQTDQLWQTIANYAAGHTVIIAIDDIHLSMTASTDPADLSIIITPAPHDDAPNFISDSQTLKDVMAGHKSLDRAVGAGKIQILAPLPDLMKIRKLVKQVLAIANTEPALQVLWLDFSTHFAA
ncbi:MAG: hypothetical protein WCO45_14440 [Pseudanabaena sp. ELA607]|jgi:hypothetical protein